MITKHKIRARNKHETKRKEHRRQTKKIALPFIRSLVQQKKADYLWNRVNNVGVPYVKEKKSIII